MRENDRRKAFTIVELIIVIAIIAILAAVLIPTFAGILKKADSSSDLQLVHHMAKALQMASQFETPDDVIDVSGILIEEGISKEALSQPVVEGHGFYWHSKHNVIVMILEEEGKEPVLVYPEDNEQIKTDLSADMAAGLLFNVLDGYEYTIKKVSTTEGLKAAMADKTKIVLTTNIVLTESIECADNITVILDLKGHTLSSTDIVIEVKTGAVLNIKNGSTDGVRLNALEGGSLNVNKVSARNTYESTIHNDGGIITLEDSTVYSSSSAIYNNEGTLTLSNTKIDAELVGIMNAGTVTVNNSTIVSHMAEAFDAVAVVNEGGSVTVIDSELKAPYMCLINQKGTVDISGSSLASDNVVVANTDETIITDTEISGRLGIHNAKGNMTINNVNASAEYVCIQNDTDGTVTVNGGVFFGGSLAVINGGYDMTLTNAQMEAGNGCINNRGEGDIDIFGGTYTCKGAKAMFSATDKGSKFSFKDGVVIVTGAINPFTVGTQVSGVENSDYKIVHAVAED